MLDIRKNLLKLRRKKLISQITIRPGFVVICEIAQLRYFAISLFRNFANYNKPFLGRKTKGTFARHFHCFLQNSKRGFLRGSAISTRRTGPLKPSELAVVPPGVFIGRAKEDGFWGNFLGPRPLLWL